MPLVDEIENDYLRNSYRLQLMQIHAASNLSLNEVSTSREICQEALNQNLEVFFPSLYSNFYHIMATSYLFTSFEDTIHWLNKASNCLFSLSPNHIQFQTSEIQQTLYFAENFWRRNLNYLPTDPSEAAHRLIVMNKKKKLRKFLLIPINSKDTFLLFKNTIMVSFLSISSIYRILKKSLNGNQIIFIYNYFNKKLYIVTDLTNT